MEASVVARNALYFRYRLPSNRLSEAPLAVKKVAPVPSGPTKLNGPATLLLPAAWNFTVVFPGAAAVHESVVQCGVSPGIGLASLSDETRSPEATKVVGVMCVMK